MARPSLDGHRPRGRFSALTLRILAVNVVALGVLVGGVLYLDSFRTSLIVSRMNALLTQGQIIAGALGLAASSGPEAVSLDLEPARFLLRRLTATIDTRARLFNTDGRLIADTDRMGLGNQIHQVALPPLDSGPGLLQWLYDIIEPILPNLRQRSFYVEYPVQQATDYPEALASLGGYKTVVERVTENGVPYLSVGIPVTRFRKVLGGLMLSVAANDIDKAIRNERLVILEVFGVALGLTILLSFFLAHTIAWPIHKLAEAAETVREEGPRSKTEIPDFSRRQDEIGDLSVALKTMTRALFERIGAIESFAADVAHEIKNPLSSINSAIETVERTTDAAIRQRLLKIIANDVRRLDRLISEISDASRLDAELARDERSPVDLDAMVRGLLAAYADLYDETGPHFSYHGPDGGKVQIVGSEERLGHVFRNLIDNAISFSPKDGTVRAILTIDGEQVTIMIEDEGPGIAPEAVERIFERFYTERPSEHFGNHSGLGLNIARQIVIVHNGFLSAENRTSPRGDVLGARFMVTLPSMGTRGSRRSSTGL